MRHRSSLGVVGVAAAILAVSAALSAQQGNWRSPAGWDRSFSVLNMLRKPVRGAILIEPDGVSFRSSKFTRRWTCADIHTFDLSTHELTLTTYENRHWREPGERRYRFTFSEAIPAAVSASLSECVGKPVRNNVAPRGAAAFAEIPAHLRARFGGSNGMLRLREEGIDYVAEDGHDSRSWRWADIQTIANPNPYELRVTAYREIAEFELKHALPRAQFERLWDRLYDAGLNVSAGGGR